MPFLLLLSALLTALTGVVSGVRPVEISAQRATASPQSLHLAVTAAPFVAGHRHLLGDFAPPGGVTMPSARPLLLTAAPRLYLDRPRA